MFAFGCSPTSALGYTLKFSNGNGVKCALQDKHVIYYVIPIGVLFKLRIEQVFGDIKNKVMCVVDSKDISLVLSVLFQVIGC